MTVNWKSIKYAISIVLAGLVLTGCLQSEYTKMVKAELAKGIRQDSIILGIRFGDNRNDFYGKCFDLNKKGLVTAGLGNSVQYLFDDSTVHKKPTPMRMLFYPTYDTKDNIAEMNLEFSYVGWSPWNKELQSDSLKAKTMELLLAWYKGNGFVDADMNDSTVVQVKLDCNRRIMIKVKDAQNVDVKIQDILHPRFRHSITPEPKADAEKK